MTKLRASLVCEPTLAMDAREIDLEDFIYLGKGEDETGGRKRDSIVSDAFEALIGAIFLDGGIEEAKYFILKFALNDIEKKKLFYDSKTVLQERVNSVKNENLVYEIIKEWGRIIIRHMKLLQSLTVRLSVKVRDIQRKRQNSRQHLMP